jgi:diguanylate cyclase (GGDEF)-like protein/PAS domain S-box-containing protein
MMSPEAAAHPEHEELLRFLYQVPVGLMRIGRDGEIQLANPAAARMLMPVAPGAELRNFYDVIHEVAPELRDMVAAFVPPQGTVCEQHRIYIPRNERSRPQAALAATIARLDHDSYMVALSDLMKTLDFESRLFELQENVDAVLSGLRDYAIYLIDPDGRIIEWNQTIQRVTGFERDDVEGRHFSVLYPDEDRDPEWFREVLARALAEGRAELEGSRLHKERGRFWGNSVLTPIHDVAGRHRGFAVIGRDISERRRIEEELRRGAITDFLTGLYNRRYFSEAAARELARYRREGSALSLVTFDVDHFKQINDRHGHDAGDRVLRALADACLRAVRGADVLARLGGEEFGLLLPATSLQGALAVAENLRRTVAALEVEAADARVGFTCSFGVAVAGAATADVDDLLKRADIALYAAKQAGRNCVRAESPAADAVAG